MRSIASSAGMLVTDGTSGRMPGTGTAFGSITTPGTPGRWPCFPGQPLDIGILERRQQPVGVVVPDDEGMRGPDGWLRVKDADLLFDLVLVRRDC